MERPTGTKAALLEAAGELFAQLGFDGTSIRAISERTGANVAAINYHFGSKENLYAEVLRNAVLRMHVENPEEMLREGLEHDSTPQVLADLIYKVVRNHLRAYFSEDVPEWCAQVLMRSLLEPSPALQELIRQFFVPEHNLMKELIRRAKPDASDDEIVLHAFAIVGQVAFFKFGEIPILTILNKDRYDDVFLDMAVKHAAGIVCLALGLPPPAAVTCR